MRVHLLAAALSLSLVGVSPASEPHASTKVDTDIPAESLGMALKALARQRGFQILYRSELVRDVRTAGASGKLTSHEALSELLRGTGLTYRYVDGHTVMVARPGTINSASKPSIQYRESRGSLPARDHLAEAGPEIPTGAAATGDPNALPSNGASPPSAQDPPTQIKEVVVTGTLIPTSPDSVVVPVTTLDASTLQQTGITNDSLALLRKAVPIFAGRSNAGTSNAQNRNQFTAGGSQAELRNLPTLVLVDGQRLALDAVAGLNGAKDFVDVSQIPAAALERVDVLSDGASSLYGSDAIGGVVNFMLKHNYHGVTAGVNYGSAEGGYNERSAFLTGGADFGPINITATASYSKSTPLWQYQRSFASPTYGVVAGAGLPGAVGGGTYVLAPGLTAPNVPTGTAATAASYAQLAAQGVYDPTSASALSNGFDYSRYAMTLQQEEHDNFVATLESKPLFGGSVKLFGDVLLSQNKVLSTAWPLAGQPFSYSTITVPADAPYNPLTTAATGVAVVDTSLPQAVRDTTDAYRVVAGMKGRIAAGWMWQSSIDYSESKLTEKDTNLLYQPNVALAVAGGYDANGNPVAGGAYSKVHTGYSVNTPLVLQPAFNPFANGGLTSAQLANLFGAEVLHGDSKLYSWDGHVVGSPFSLPAGKVNLAAGLTWRREEVSGHADPNGRVTDPTTGLTNGNDQNWIGGVYTDPFSHGRDDSAVYAETLIPITSARTGVPGLHQFELTAAARFEHYNDAGSATTPKFGFRWEPFDSQFAIHATYAKSFVAPPLYDSYGPYSTGPSPGTLIASVFGPNYKNIPYFNGENGTNSTLKPANSLSRSIGFQFRPNFIRGLSVTADFSSVDLFGFQGGANETSIMQSVNALGSASPYFNSVATGNFNNLGGTDPFGTPGSLQAFLTNPVTKQGNPANAAQLYVTDYFRNENVVTERSWTVGLGYVLPWNRYGTWTLSSTGAVFDSLDFQRIPGDVFGQYAGNAANIGVFAGTLPKYRAYSTLDWAYDNIDLTLANTYISKVYDTGVRGNLPGIQVPSYSVWDLHGEYDWQLGGANDNRKLTLTVGVNNIANTMPPMFPRSFSNTYTNTDTGTYSPIGRLLYGGLSVSF